MSLPEGLVLKQPERKWPRSLFPPRPTFQRTSWGGGKKRGLENLTNDTPPKNGFWTPPCTVRFPPLSGVSALFFLYKNPRQRRPEASALLEGSKNFRESAFSGAFSSPHTFCTPPYHGPNLGQKRSGAGWDQDLRWARFARIDSQIRLRIALRGAKIANRRFEASPILKKPSENLG